MENARVDAVINELSNNPDIRIRTIFNLLVQAQQLIVGNREFAESITASDILFEDSMYNRWEQSSPTDKKNYISAVVIHYLNEISSRRFLQLHTQQRRIINSLRLSFRNWLIENGVDYNSEGSSGSSPNNYGGMRKKTRKTGKQRKTRDKKDKRKKHTRKQ